MRNVGVDLLRLVGLAAVVAGHVWNSEVSNELLYSWHVPIFFFLSGYFWREERGIKSEIAARTRSLIRPYLFWLAVISAGFVIVHVLQGTLDYKVIAALLLGGSYLTRPFSAFWFVTALAFATVLYRAIALRRWMLLVVVGSGLAFAYLAPETLASIPLGLGVAIPALVFILAGHYIKTLRLEKRLGSSAWVALLLFSLALFLFGYVRPLDIKAGDFGTPVLSIVFSTVICLSLTALSLEVGGNIDPTRFKWISELALESLVVVLAHAAVIWIIAPFDLSSVVEFIAAVLVPVLTSVLLRRMPKLWELGTGAKAKTESLAADQLQTQKSASAVPGDRRD